ncbi:MULTISPECIES: transketolase family protein [Clostridia]|uniref:transketolase family protein n=1 Tax=Clostridia TaxID=186801 RepID=UPI0023EF64BF|nr:MULTISPECIES: transketolase family protein [Clostridia]MDD4692023.1 transketolase family protein [Eubacterium aggregans]MEA5004691.1 transketolase family protein [Christensenella sp.]
MSKIATREAYGKYLVELGEKNENIVVLDADLSGATKTADFKKAIPERHFNAGIAECDMMGMAAGLSTTGKIPFASTFAIFGAGRAFEVIRNSICYPKMNVKVACTHAGLSVGEDGGSHQSVEDIALMRVLPNMTVLVPADAVETKRMMDAAVELNGPVYLRLGRLATEVILPEDYQFELGKAVTLKEGTDVTIIAIGLMVEKAVEAAEILAGEGISARVLNMGCIKPIDRDAIVAAAKETGAIVTAEEHSIIGGLAGAVCEVLAETLPAPVEKVGIMDQFGQSGKAVDVLEHYNLNTAAIVEAAKKAVGRK